MHRIATILFAVFLVVLFLAGLLLHVRNSEPVTVDFYAGSVQLPLAYLLVGALAAGACAGWLASVWSLIALHRRLRRLLKENQRAQAEVSAARLFADDAR